jgi:hypothetical protein
MDDDGPLPRRYQPRVGRTLLVRILVLVGALLAIVSLLAGYIRFQGLDTPTVEDTAGELIADPEVRDEVATTLVEQLYANVDVEEALRERLPADQQGLAGPISAALRVGIDRIAHRLLERPRAQELWVNAIGAAHRNLVRVLEDELGPLRTEGGDIVLDLRPLLLRLGEQLAILGQIDERLEADAGQITIMEADQLETAQDATRLMKVLGMWLWLVPIGLWAVALWLAGERRRATLRMIGWSTIVAGLLVLVVRRFAGSVVVDELASTESIKAAAGSAWDIITAQLRDGGLTLAGIGIALLVAVWIAGPSERATQSRRFLAPYLERAEIAFGAAGALLLLLVWWGPTVQTQRWQLVLVTAIVLALGVEVLRRQTAREFSSPATTPAPAVQQPES